MKFLIFIICSFQISDLAGDERNVTIDMATHGPKGGIAVLKSCTEGIFVGHRIELFNADGQLRSEMRVPTQAPITSVRFSSSGNLIGITNEIGQAFVWKVANLKLEKYDLGKPIYVCRGRFESREDFFSAVTPGFLGKSALTRWDLGTGRSRSVNVDGNLIDGFFLNDHAYFYSTDQTVRFIDELDDQKNYNIPKAYAKIILAPDQATCLLLTCDVPFGGVGPWHAEVRDVPNNRSLGVFEVCSDSLVSDPVFSKDSKSVFYAQNRQTYASYHIPSGKQTSYVFNDIHEEMKVLTIGVAGKQLRVVTTFGGGPRPNSIGHHVFERDTTAAEPTKK